MGVNCCSYEKEPMEITVMKPEENINDKIINQKKEQYDTNNVNILDLEQNQNKNIIDNSLNQPYYYSANQSSTSPMSQKEIDDLLNQAFNNENNNQNIYNNNNNNIENLIPNQNENLNLDNLYQNQTNGQNGQNISIEKELDKYISSQQNTENNQIEYQNNTNLEEILKQQSNQSNTDLNIDEILKNSGLKTNEQVNNNNLNLDSLFNQQKDSQIDDDLINKIFEYSEQRTKNNPLYLSQQIKPTQMNNILNNDNNIYYSPNNSTQRSGILNSVSAKI